MNRDGFVFSLIICMLFLDLLTCRIFSVMLKRSGECKYFCFILNPRGKIFSLSM